MMQDISNLSHFCTWQAHDKHMTSTWQAHVQAHTIPHMTNTHLRAYTGSVKPPCSCTCSIRVEAGRSVADTSTAITTEHTSGAKSPLASLSAFTQQHKVHELVSKHSHKQTIYAHIRSVQSKRYRQGRHSTTCVIESHALPHSQLARYYF